MTWRCSFDDALRPVEATEVCDSPYRIERGAMAALCAHEAAHAVAVVSMGGRIEQIEVGLTFQWYYGGKTRVRPRGVCVPMGATQDSDDVFENVCPRRRASSSPQPCLAFVGKPISRK
jgi:hypothetical protein